MRERRRAASDAIQVALAVGPAVAQQVVHHLDQLPRIRKRRRREAHRSADSAHSAKDTGALVRAVLEGRQRPPGTEARLFFRANAMSQQALDRQRTSFWGELCGSSMAVLAGITGRDPRTTFGGSMSSIFGITRTSRATSRCDSHGKNVLEIGLGYGTLGQLLAERRADCHGVDIAPEPVAMMRHAAAGCSGTPDERVVEASALELPVRRRDLRPGLLDRLPASHGRPPAQHRRGSRVLIPSGRAV